MYVVIYIKTIFNKYFLKIKSKNQNGPSEFNFYTKLKHFY